MKVLPGSAWAAQTLVLLLFLGGTQSLAAPPAKPTRATFRKAFEAARPTIVRVRGAKKTGTGILVGAKGHVLTSSSLISSGPVKIEIAGRKARQAKPLMTLNEHQVIVLELTQPGTYPSVAVQLEPTLGEGEWLVGVFRESKNLIRPKVGRIRKGQQADGPYFETDMNLPPGSALLNPQGRLVAIVVEKMRKGGSRALPMVFIKKHLESELASESADSSNSPAASVPTP